MKIEKEVIIHAGFHKTGSSSIQKSLAYNRDILMSQGYHYPDIKIDGIKFYNSSVPLYGRYAENPQEFVHYWYYNNLSAKVANSAIDNLFNSKLWNENKLIISDEFISRLSSSELIKLKEDFKSHGYRIRVISYIREPLNLMSSMVQQYSRLQSIRETIESNALCEVSEHIPKIIEVFKEEAEFYSFEKACQHIKGPVGFFFDLLNIDLPTDRVLKVNEGMSMQSVRLMSFVNDIFPEHVRQYDDITIRKKFGAQLLSKIKGEKFKLNALEVKAIESDVIKARAIISNHLGEDFLPPTDYSYSDECQWGGEQLEYIMKIQNTLSLDILLPTYQFLSTQNITDPDACQKRLQLGAHIRQRLDKEVAFRRCLRSLKAFAEKLKVYKAVEWFLLKFTAFK